MQQDCARIMVPLIWYRVIPPCWCNSPVWIPFGSPAPKLDLRSPQGVSVLINVAGPNSGELIQLWSDHRHICLTLHPSISFFPLVSPQESMRSICFSLYVRTASKNVTCLMFFAPHVTQAWRPLISVKSERRDMVRKQRDICFELPRPEMCRCRDDTWDSFGARMSPAFLNQHQYGGQK